MERMHVKTFVESDISTWTSEDHRRLAAEGEALFSFPMGTREAARFEEIMNLIEAYEDIHIPVEEPSAEAMAEFYRDNGRVLAVA